MKKSLFFDQKVCTIFSMTSEGKNVNNSTNLIFFEFKRPDPDLLSNFGQSNLRPIFSKCGVAHLEGPGAFFRNESSINIIINIFKIKYYY